MSAAKKYKRGDIIREDSGEEYLVVADGVDKAGQIHVRALAKTTWCLTPKPGRFRKLRGATDHASKVR